MFFANYSTVELNNGRREGDPVCAGTLGTNGCSEVPLEIDQRLARGEEGQCSTPDFLGSATGVLASL
jgi:hypothetical protein